MTASCKNCVTVGASENSNSGGGRQDGNVAVFSSQGPGPGGSIKPDVVAPGFLITSANSNDPAECGRTEMAGTSMATPITSGNAALLRQYLLEGWYPSGTKGGSHLAAAKGLHTLGAHPEIWEDPVVDPLADRQENRKTSVLGLGLNSSVHSQRPSPSASFSAS